MTNLFISYSRKDITTALKMVEALKHEGFDVWIDMEGIQPTREWRKEIERGIEGSDTFLFLLSPDSAKSEVCGDEIEHAVKNGKRLVPIVIRNVAADEAPAPLRPLNWIFLRETDDFSTGFRKLVTALQTDYEWAQAHRELQVKALEWDRSHRDPSFLLQGTELQSAEAQLATNAAKEPSPTELQREYVLRSRQAAEERRRRTTGIAIVHCCGYPSYTCHRKCK
jgi:hypothetical protein